jgi:polysaccharide biosynthesis protein PslG
LVKKTAAALALCVTLLVSVVATAGAKTSEPRQHVAAPPISYGVADDTGKYSDDGGAWFDGMLQSANLTQERWTLSFDGNATTIKELPFIQRAAPQALKDGIHVVLALYGRPATMHDPAAFCSWAGLVASTVTQWGIHDFIVWNEPNTALYWSPQDSSSAAAYEALLATCYDTIHAADPAARVIGFGLSPRSNGPSQTAPIPFIRAVGAAYRASGRTAPIMDQMSIHPYPNPNSPTDGPDVGYKNPDAYGVPNLDRVKQAIYDAFNGTKQPTTLNGLTFRIDELGWQTITKAYTQYYNDENVAVVSEQTQVQYMQRAIQKYLACDPTVTDVEWFLLVDEATRNGKDRSNTTSIGGGWQSGLLTAGGQGVSTPKPAYAAIAPLLAEGRAACTAGMINWTPTTSSTSGTGGQTTTTPGGKPSTPPKHKPKGPAKPKPPKKHT